jgi:hypothetical protein
MWIRSQEGMVVPGEECGRVEKAGRVRARDYFNNCSLQDLIE